MKRSASALLLLASFSLSGASFAACVAPEDPQIPSGAEASGADMLKAKKAVEGYVSEAEAYMACGIASTQQERMASKMEKVVEQFNKELRTYKARG